MIWRTNKMLREVIIDKKPDGRLTNVPSEVVLDKMDQYVKRFIETADVNRQDGSGLVSLFRSFHGGEWTLLIIDNVISELHNPQIRLQLHSDRIDLVPFFEWVRRCHLDAVDADFDYPHDHSKLPL